MMAQAIVFTAFFSLILGWTQTAGAASAFKKALDQKTNRYIDKGTVIGGEAGQAFSLIRVRSQLDPKKKVERIVLNLGDKDGKVLKGEPSFYQVNLEPERSRIVISLSQVSRSKVSQAQLSQTFKNSPYVKSAQMISDAESSSTNLILNLKSPVRAEVFQMSEKGKPGRVVLDLVTVRR